MLLETTHAAHITEILIENGINAKFVTESTPTNERDQIVKTINQGVLKCLVNNMIFTTGYNNPMLDLIACMRPTQSEGLWVNCRSRDAFVSRQTKLFATRLWRNLETNIIDKIRGKM